MAAFEYRQAEEIRDVFRTHGVRCLFIGKSGAILLGYPDTTQDVVLYVAKDPGEQRGLGGGPSGPGIHSGEGTGRGDRAGKDFVQLKNGSFDLDLIFAPDGIERSEDAYQRHVEVDGFPVCHIDDIIASKKASRRAKDRESLPRLVAFRDYWMLHRRR